jgi:hypothetical protein
MPVTYVKTIEDENIEKQDMATNRTLKHLQDLNYYKFSVGDVLVREERRGDKWVLYMAQCGLPYKYVYVFENALGVGYIRRMSVEGNRFVESPMCVVNFDPADTRFRVDPSYADHLLLQPDVEFDFQTDYKEAKKRRNAMHRANNNLQEKMSTDAEVVSFIKRLKAGDQLWTGWSHRNIYKDPRVVAAVHVDNLRPESSYIELASQWGGSRSDRIDFEQVRTTRWWTSRPQFFEELL